MARAIVPLAPQIDEVTREVSLRQALHPAKVRTGQITQMVSDMQIARMEAALKTLRFVRENADAIRAATGGKLPWEATA